MNVYFLDPTYLKDSVWEPLLSCLKVKSVYSFFTREQLSKALLDKIDPMMYAVSNGENSRPFADKCTFWLCEMIESNVKLLTTDYPRGNCPIELRKNYSSISPINNIMNIEDPNCLVLLQVKSSSWYDGTLDAPSTYVSYLESNIATYVSSYCLNILHKRYNHNHYDSHISFIEFDEFFRKSFRYIHQWREWQEYSIPTKNHQHLHFTRLINGEVSKIAPNDFPIIEKDGRRMLTSLMTDEGTEKCKSFIKILNESKREYAEEREREETASAEAEQWRHDVAEMNRAFWDECGEGGSNCESWPGWD